MKKLLLIFFMSFLFFSCGKEGGAPSGVREGGVPIVSEPTSQVAKVKIDLELFLETSYNLDSYLIGMPITLRITLLNPNQTSIHLGKDWHRNFTVSLQRYDGVWKPQPFKYKVDDHFDLQSSELKKALTLLYSIETAELPPAKYKLGVEADAPTFFSQQQKELIFELKPPITSEEKTAGLFYRASQAEDVPSIIKIADEIIGLNEPYFAYSVYLLKAQAHAKAMYKSLEINDLQAAQKSVNQALSEYDTFFLKNNLDIKAPDIRDWNDFFVETLTQYDVLERLRGSIDLELKP